MSPNEDQSEENVVLPFPGLCCPICHQWFNNPVSTIDGHSFCKACIEKKWAELDGKPAVSPLTNLPLLSTMLLRNCALEVATLEAQRRSPMHIRADIPEARGAGSDITDLLKVLLSERDEALLQRAITLAQIKVDHLVEARSNLEYAIAEAQNELRKMEEERQSRLQAGGEEVRQKMQEISLEYLLHDSDDASERGLEEDMRSTPDLKEGHSSSASSVKRPVKKKKKQKKKKIKKNLSSSIDESLLDSAILEAQEEAIEFIMQSTGKNLYSDEAMRVLKQLMCSQVKESDLNLVLTRLCSDPAFEESCVQRARYTARRQGIVVPLIACLQRYTCPLTLDPLLRLLALFTEGDSENVGQAIVSGAIEAILETLRTHDDVVVQHAGWCAMLSFTGAPIAKNIIAQENGIFLIVKAMQRFPEDERLQKSALVFLASACTDHKQNSMDAVNYGAPAAIVAALRLWGGEGHQSVVEWSFMTMRVLLTSGHSISAMQNLVVVDQVHKAIIETMLKHKDCPDVQAHGLAALFHLACDERTRARLRIDMVDHTSFQTAERCHDDPLVIDAATIVFDRINGAGTFLQRWQEAGHDTSDIQDACDLPMSPCEERLQDWAEDAGSFIFEGNSRTARSRILVGPGSGVFPDSSNRKTGLQAVFEGMMKNGTVLD